MTPLHAWLHASIRRKLLAITLLPLLVVLPLLGIVLLLGGNRIFNELMVTKVRSDLAVAQGYFERVLAEVDAGATQAAASQRLHSALMRGDPLQPLLSQVRGASALDYVNFRDASGQLVATDWSPMPPSTSAAQAEGQAQRASLAVLPLDAQADLAPALRERARIPLVPTPNAAPTTRTQEDRALVVRALTPVHAEGGRLLGHIEAGVLLNQNLPFIDNINAIVYPEGSLPFGSQGTATLFLDDVRITTNVRLFQGGRAIGTRVSQAVRDAVMGQGETWLDRAFVVDDWYVSGYHPLLDAHGQRVAMLYVGILERPFVQVKYALLAGIGVIFFGVMLLAAWFSLRQARGIFQPLERMSSVMAAVESGTDDARVGNLAQQDEIGRLAGHLDHLLDTLHDKTQVLRRWGEELDAKVAARTQELEASHARLRATQAQLIKSEKLAAIGQLTAGIAHEINNPIAVIQGNLDLARDTLAAAAEPVDAEFRLIDQQISRMRLIVTQLLQYARPTDFAGYVDTVSPREAIDASLVLVRHQLTRHGLTVHREDHTRRAVAINRQELQQVLINLIINAIDAMQSPQGDVATTAGHILIRTEDAVDAQGHRGVNVHVADEGPGLSAEVLGTLFQPFVTHKSQGTGLGLWISRSLVERYGGDVRAANRQDGTGAVFTVWLRSDLDAPLSPSS